MEEKTRITEIRTATTLPVVLIKLERKSKLVSATNTLSVRIPCLPVLSSAVKLSFCQGLFE